MQNVISKQHRGNKENSRRQITTKADSRQDRKAASQHANAASSPSIFTPAPTTPALQPQTPTARGTSDESTAPVMPPHPTTSTWTRPRHFGFHTISCTPVQGGTCWIDVPLPTIILKINIDIDITQAAAFVTTSTCGGLSFSVARSTL